MNSLKTYFKNCAPDYADLQRLYEGYLNQSGEPVCRLVLTPDITLTSFDKPASYRAHQMDVFINMNSDVIENIFHYAHIISYDTAPHADKDGNFVNKIGVWVRQENIERALSLLGQQRWISSIGQDRTCIVRPNGFEKARALSPAI